ncbi:hypothetical protein [Bradyrhizobium sp. Tv2a-2]|uniref:hypothetical protein n=1 Tax=Bradyrhizobium sp. Tv2a-2 TaxID=113395 RepID=UPI000403365F|nr:hypothetical protein [Bradyrhizobium sp. Tv2a-2]
MALLVRVEVAREQRRRAELLVAERRLAEAAVAAADAAREHLEAQVQRQTLLWQHYRAILGLRSVTDIQKLRTTEQMLTARLESAGQAQHAAEAAEVEAIAARDRARQTLQTVSLRRLRRSRMADMLQQQEKQAAMLAEEESVSDELMDRIRGTVNE